MKWTIPGIGNKAHAAGILDAAKTVLSNSPHPAIAVLHQFFSRDQDKDSRGRCGGNEKSELKVIASLIAHVKNNNIHWKKDNWLGPRVMDVTIYVAFKTESKNYSGDNYKKPFVLDNTNLYKSRVKEITKFVKGVNKKYKLEKARPRDWPSLENEGAKGMDAFYVDFHVVPVLEDHPNSTGGGSVTAYSTLATLCKDALNGVKNVYFRRTPDPETYRENEKYPPVTPFRYLESHPYDAELKPLLARLDTAAQNFRTARQEVAALRQEYDRGPSGGDLEARLSQAQSVLTAAKGDYKEVQRLYLKKDWLKKRTDEPKKSEMKSFGGNYGYLTGDCAPDWNWWSAETDMAMVKIAEDYANVSKKVLGVLLFNGSWQGRPSGSSTIPCMDDRQYVAVKTEEWADVMSVGTDALGGDGKTILLAATPPPSK